MFGSTLFAINNASQASKKVSSVSRVVIMFKDLTAVLCCAALCCVVLFCAVLIVHRFTK